MNAVDCTRLVYEFGRHRAVDRVDLSTLYGAV